MRKKNGRERIRILNGKIERRKSFLTKIISGAINQRSKMINMSEFLKMLSRIKMPSPKEKLQVARREVSQKVQMMILPSLMFLGTSRLKPWQVAELRKFAKEKGVHSSQKK